MDAKEQPTWITIWEAVQELQMPLTRCYILIQAGDLPAVRLGERSIRVHHPELEQFLLQNRRVVALDPVVSRRCERREVGVS